MSVSTRTSIFVSISVGVLAAAGCGGGGDDTVTVVDAALDAAIDAIPIDAPPACNAPRMTCGGACVDVVSNEEFCGNCQTSCTGGQLCTASQCACPAAGAGVPASLSGGLGLNIGGLELAASGFTGNVGIVLSDDQTMENMPYTMTEAGLGTFPTVAWALNADFQNMTADAAFVATAGTLTITKLCLDDPQTQLPAAEGGVMATLTDAKFSAVDGLLSGNPVLTPGGCTLPATGTYPTITINLGNTSCSAAAQ